MLKGVTIGQFVPGNSFVHRLDPHKLLVSLVLVVSIFTIAKPPGFALLASFILLATVVSRIPVWMILRVCGPSFFCL